ncbi:MAG: hypothetical protein E7555_03710 [Ruminococcaceae bacterium]|nr:hypothetical protein [Oscillospiraceae bacterium]
MEKPYISITAKFNPVIHCSHMRKRSSAIIHVTDYYDTPLDLYKDDWCKVRGILHLGFNNTENQEDSFNKELAEKTAQFMTNMVKHRVDFLYIFYHPKDAVQAKSIGYAIKNYMRDSNIQPKNAESKNDVAYKLMFEAMEDLNAPKYNKKTKIAKCN